ncbi:MAG: RNA polymerase sigma-70 factor [Bacteroidia bacterium]|nr:RNA polymerase sigma-70 factor [Bacteroidia bacterium]
MQIEQLFKQHYARLCSTAYRLVNNQEVAEDIVQELFLKLLDRAESIQIKTTEEGYLVRSVTNMALDYLKKNKRFLYVEPETHLARATDKQGADQKINVEELTRIVNSALNKLPPKCRVIFVLSRFEEMKYREIAEHLDISVKTVENQMGIAIGKLQNELKTSLKDDYGTLLYVLLFLEFGHEITNWNVFGG